MKNLSLLPFKKYDAYIVGYYGMHNTGDDALMQASIWGAKTFLGCHNIQVSGPVVMDNNLNVAQNSWQYKIKGCQRIAHYYNAIRSHRVIFGGGSVLHSARDINLKRHLIELSGRHKSMAIGIGIEPFKHFDDEYACRKFLHECAQVSLRDWQSYEIAKALAPDANLSYGFDLAPLLLKQVELQPGQRSGIGINLCPVALDAFGKTDQEQEKQRLLAMYQAIVSIWQHSNEAIHLLCFNQQADKGDHLILQQLKKLLAAKGEIKLVDYHSDPLRMLKHISQLKLLVGMRLHSNIFAYMANTPFIAINYHPKNKNWCREVAQSPDYQFDAQPLDSHRLAQQILFLLGSPQATAKLELNTAFKRSLLNWSSSYETSQNICRHTAL